MASNKLFLKLGYFLIASIYLPIELNYLSLQHFFVPQKYIKEYIRYSYPSPYVFSVMKPAAYGEYHSWNHKFIKRLALESPDMQFQSQLTFDLIQRQRPFICSFIDSFVRSTYISPEQNMDLSCGIEE